MFQSIASCQPLLCWNKKEKTRSIISLSVPDLISLVFVLSCPAEHDRNPCWESCFTPCVQVGMADDARQIL